MKNIEFMECEDCRSKSGTPTLCESCIHNRDIIEHLKDEILKGREETASGSRMGYAVDGVQGKGGPKDLGGESFWNERKEFINNDPMFHTYYGLYRNGVDLDELKDQMITQLLNIKKELTEKLIDAEQRAMPLNWVGENL